MARRGLGLVVVGVLACGLLLPVATVLAAEPPPSLGWAVAVGGGGGQTGFEVEVDDAGNVYTVGGFAKTVDFDPGPGTFKLTSAGEEDVFVSKLDGDGNFVWARAVAMGGKGHRGTGVAVDGSGNVYTTGKFSGTADFDPGPGTFNLTSAGQVPPGLVPNPDVFVSKLDGDGNFVWAVAMGGERDDQAFGVTVDDAGSAYITGYFRDTADFDPGPGTFSLTSHGGSSDVFVWKLDSDGNLVWAAAMGGTTVEGGLGVAMDGSGNVYTTGSFQGTADFDPGPRVFNLASAGGRDVFVSKLDVNGDFVWAVVMGGERGDQAFGVAVDDLGNVYTTGSFQATADFDPGPGTFNLTSAGGDDVFVSKLDSNGNLLWAAGMGGTSNDHGNGVDVDDAGNVHAVGQLLRTADFDPGPGTFSLTSNGSTDVFVSKLDVNGDFVWAVSMGAQKGDQGLGVAVSGSGNVYTTGHFWKTVDFDPGPGTFVLTSAGQNDGFVSKLVAYPPPGATCAGLAATIVGTSGDDVIDGTAQRDVIAALDGDDEVNGSGGDDVICGGPGDDELRGDRGRDLVLGQAGNDRVLGGPHGDELNGGTGNDHLVGGGGPDLLEGGIDDDRLDGNSGGDTLRGGPGFDRLNGGPGPDQCFGEIIKNC